MQPPVLFIGVNTNVSLAHSLLIHSKFPFSVSELGMISVNLHLTHSPSVVPRVFFLTYLITY